MSDEIKSGPRKTPEEERKFGLNLRGELFFYPDKAINVIICGEEDLDNDQLYEAVSKKISDDSLRGVGKTMLVATISPPDVRSQLIHIAASDAVTKLVLDEPMM